MTTLQQFMTRALAQATAVICEPVIINGQNYLGTFGDAIMTPVMSRNGYEDRLVVMLHVARSQFSNAPAPRQSVIRSATDPQREYFVQAVDDSDPVIYKLMLVDRQV